MHAYKYAFQFLTAIKVEAITISMLIGQNVGNSKKYSINQVCPLGADTWTFKFVFWRPWAMLDLSESSLRGVSVSFG